MSFSVWLTSLNMIISRSIQKMQCLWKAASHWLVRLCEVLGRWNPLALWAHRRPRVPGSCSITCVSISGEEQEDLGPWVLGLRSSGHDLEVQASVPPTSHQQGLSHTATPGCKGWGWMEPPVFLVVICCCLVANLCPTLCDPMDCITPGFLILNCLPEFAQTHVHWVCDAIQPSHPLLPLLLLPCLSQHQGLLQWVSSSHYVTKGLEL